VNKPISVVELKIESNSGNKDYTCLYKFRVHGNLYRDNQTTRPPKASDTAEQGSESMLKKVVENVNNANMGQNLNDKN
jgi:hypothetical protein